MGRLKKIKAGELDHEEAAAQEEADDVPMISLLWLVLFTIRLHSWLNAEGYGEQDLF